MDLLAASYIEHIYRNGLFKFDVTLKTKWSLRTTIVLFMKTKCKHNVLVRSLRQWEYYVHIH